MEHCPHSFSEISFSIHAFSRRVIFCSVVLRYFSDFSISWSTFQMYQHQTDDLCFTSTLTQQHSRHIIHNWTTYWSASWHIANCQFFGRFGWFTTSTFGSDFIFVFTFQSNHDACVASILLMVLSGLALSSTFTTIPSERTVCVPFSWKMSANKAAWTLCCDIWSVTHCQTGSELLVSLSVSSPRMTASMFSNRRYLSLDVYLQDQMHTGRFEVLGHWRMVQLLAASPL